MNNASLATIRGLKAGVEGQLVTIVSVGVGQVDLAHQNAGATAANRLLNISAATQMSLAPGSGVATYQYDAATQRGFRLPEGHSSSPQIHAARRAQGV